LSQRRWQDSLDSAEKGLEIDPEDTGCINARAMALVKLGRKQQADAAIAAALELNPDNAFTHANHGWNYLAQGNPRKAQEHFREALRLDPELDYARAGIVEAMKARNIVYRAILGYFLWISRFSERTQWTILIGGYVAYRLLANVARKNPDLSIWIQPLLWAYIAFAVLTWIADPVFNLMLRLSRDGRLALNQDQIRASNWVGACLGTALVLLIPTFLWPESYFPVIALMAGLMVLPTSGIFRCDPGWPRRWMTIYTLGMLILFLGATLPAVVPLFVHPVTDDLNNLLERILSNSIVLFLIAAFLSQFLVNWLVARTPRR
jgi:tetratricopeptide (TPR) repeat protein